MEAQMVRVGDAETSLDAVGTLSLQRIGGAATGGAGGVATINFAEGGSVYEGRDPGRARQLGRACRAGPGRGAAEPGPQQFRARQGAAPQQCRHAARARRGRCGAAHGRRRGRPCPGPARQAHAGGTVRGSGGPAQRQPGRLRRPRTPRSSISSRSTRSRWTSACRSCSCRPWRRASGSRWRSTPIPASRSPARSRRSIRWSMPAGRAVVVRAEIENDDGEAAAGPVRPRAPDSWPSGRTRCSCPEQAMQPQGDKAFVFKVVDAGDGKSGRQADAGDAGQPPPGRGRGREGLAPGDLVVTAGLLKIRDGRRSRCSCDRRAPAGQPSVAARPSPATG